MVRLTKMTAQNELEKAYKYCQTVTKTHAKSFYFAAKFLPKHKQKAVYPIYAFCRHIDDAIDEIGDGDEASAIQVVEHWKLGLNVVYKQAENENKGERTNDEGQHFVLLAWQDLLKTYKISQNLPLELMKGVVQDTHIKRYETFEELYVYCYRVASTVGLMASEIFGYADEKTLEYAEALGIAMQLTNILRDIKEDAAMDRIYLPQEDLQKFGVTEKQIFANEFNKNFVELMKFEIERVRNYYAEAEKGISLLAKDTRFTVLLASRIYAKILEEIEKQNYNVFTKRAQTTLSQKVFSVPKIWLKARKI